MNETFPEPGRARETGLALETHCRFILWLVLAVARFPHEQKFLPGDRIQSRATDVPEALLEATWTRRRDVSLSHEEDCFGSGRTLMAVWNPRIRSKSYSMPLCRF